MPVGGFGVDLLSMMSCGGDFCIVIVVVDLIFRSTVFDRFSAKTNSCFVLSCILLSFYSSAPHSYTGM